MQPNLVPKDNCTIVAKYPRGGGGLHKQRAFLSEKEDEACRTALGEEKVRIYMILRWFVIHIAPVREL
jgi:hypothetical protein